jgi:predicted HTH domain antitoxin
MTGTTETTAVYTILALAGQLSRDGRRQIADLLRRENDAPLPDHATVEEAIALYLLNACSLGRAAELAGVTRWDIQDHLKELGISIPVAGNQSAQAIDELAKQLEREGFL